MHAWVKGVNAFLPESVRIQWAMIVDESFHARHSVKEREYQYILVNDLYNSAPFHSNVGWTYHKLNTKLIKPSCLKFKGKHDFTSFRSSECQAKSPIRTIKKFLELNDVKKTIFLTPKLNYELEIKKAIKKYNIDKNKVMVITQASTGLSKFYEHCVQKMDAEGHDLREENHPIWN